MHRYKAFNNAMSTTGVQQVASTTTAIRTMLQLATPSTRQLQIISWGYSLSGVVAGAQVELLQTDVAATVTAHVAAGVQPLDPNAPASLLTLGTAATGYSASVEGTTTASRVFDAQVLAAAGANSLAYEYQWMPDERPIVAVSRFLRVRASFGTAANMLCWVVWDE